MKTLHRVVAIVCAAACMLFASATAAASPVTPSADQPVIGAFQATTHAEALNLDAFVEARKTEKAISRPGSQPADVALMRSADYAATLIKKPKAHIGA